MPAFVPILNCFKFGMRKLYADSCPSPDSMKSLYLNGYVHLYSGREENLHSYITTALRAKSAIDICTCYVFHTDAATKYVLLDLLPYIARRNGVKVRVLFEAMTLESQILHSAFDNGTLISRNKMPSSTAFPRAVCRSMEPSKHTTGHRISFEISWTSHRPSTLKSSFGWRVTSGYVIE